MPWMLRGVHPLLLAIGHERYMPFRERVPEEILTIANRILGTGQTSLAKFLFIAASDDDPNLDTHDIPHFFSIFSNGSIGPAICIFKPSTTIDTLDYSGSGWNAGSKVVAACRGEKRRQLKPSCQINFSLPEGFGEPFSACREFWPFKAPKFEVEKTRVSKWKNYASTWKPLIYSTVPLIILVPTTASSRPLRSTILSGWPLPRQSESRYIWRTFFHRAQALGLSRPARDWMPGKNRIMRRSWRLTRRSASGPKRY
jgi:3-polyprenyl-4-hydroxybenzoate decarboxylase